MDKEFNPTMKSSNKKNIAGRILFSMLLLVLIIAAGLEIFTALTSPQSWNIFLVPLQLVTIVIASLLLLGGLVALTVEIWSQKAASKLSVRTGKFKWVALAFLLLFVIWFLLFSPWQVVFTGLWTHSLFLLAVAVLVTLTSGREDVSFGWREAGLALTLLLFTETVQEARQMTPLAVVYRGVIVAGTALSAGIAILFQHTGRFDAAHNWLVTRRNRARWLRVLLAVLFSAAPVILLLVEGRMNYASYPFARLSVFLLALPCLAALVSEEKKQLVIPEGWIIAAGILLFATVFSNRLTGVTTYPFSLSWSEGNRFYDYSLSFASSLYNYPGKLHVPYFSPGRYALWGSMFLIPDLPIWVHRLWNVILQTVPALTVGWLVARPVRTSRLYLPFLFWIALYILQGPVMPPLLVASLLFLPFLLIKNPWVRAASLIAASLAAGLSRWTWAVGPGAWGALADLFLYYPQRKGNFLRRLWPTVAFALLGVLPGVLASWTQVWSRGPGFAFKQPLLWYRMWPNTTYPPGAVLGILMATGSLVILLVWLAVTRRWKMDWLQALAAGGATLAFLVTGMVISMKIGGGGDLHNFDLYILTTVLLVGLAAYALHREGSLTLRAWPRVAQVALVLVLFFPFWSAYKVSQPLPVPFSNVIHSSLQTLKAVVAKYQTKGEILFMDQRQLLTFGYIKDVPFTPDYEKKYMMDQAMAGNAPYFQAYYRDLANHRFVLIITEPLRVQHVGRERSFGEENDAWVQWVSAPTLCFYQSIQIFEDVGVELLVPNPNAASCERYLDP
jgi:hypothetical protein